MDNGAYLSLMGERGREWVGTGTYPLASGGWPTVRDFDLEDERTMDKLVARMMVHTQKVIIPCKFCGSHNAFSNPTCVQCGGPLGA